jgi:glycosyltransferase involved in cell wall biosynthesis
MTRPKTLLSIAHSYVVALNRRLAHEMAQVGQGQWEVTAVAPTIFHGKDDLRSVEFEPGCQEACRVVAVPAYLTRFVHIFTYGRPLRDLLARGWSLVHCWEEPYILAGGQVAWWTPAGTPLVYRSAQSIAKRYPLPFNWIERYAMRRSAGWVCSGRTVANNLGMRRGYVERPMRLIPLGVDLEVYRPDQAAGEAIRRSLGWDMAGPPVVGYLGRFVPEKGVEMLMGVLDRLATSWRALFVGGGKLEPALRTWADRYRDRVRICTDVRHAAVPAHLNAMDLLCAPSQTATNWREQFGRMLTEGFACGVPVVGSDSGEIPHVLQGVGEVVGEKDTDGWCRVLAELLESPARRLRMAAGGLERARTQYAWPIVARQYLDFFDQLLDSRSHRPSAPERTHQPHEFTSPGCAL